MSCTPGNQDMGTDDTAAESSKSEHQNRNETKYTNSGDEQTENANQSLKSENQCTSENINQILEKGSPENLSEISRGNAEKNCK